MTDTDSDNRRHGQRRSSFEMRQGERRDGAPDTAAEWPYFEKRRQDDRRTGGDRRHAEERRHPDAPRDTADSEPTDTD